MDIWYYLFSLITCVLLFTIFSNVLVVYEHDRKMDLLHADMVYYILLAIVSYTLTIFLASFIKIEKQIQKQLAIEKVINE